MLLKDQIQPLCSLYNIGILNNLNYHIDRQNFSLHKFLKSDPDELHDHPWDFITIILRGGYWEHTLEGKFWKKPFSIHYRKAIDLHRIELDKKVSDVWTLFIPLRRKREWGFKTDKGWVHNEKYLQEC